MGSGSACWRVSEPGGLQILVSISLTGSSCMKMLHPGLGHATRIAADIGRCVTLCAPRKAHGRDAETCLGQNKLGEQQRLTWILYDSILLIPSWKMECV